MARVLGDVSNDDVAINYSFIIITSTVLRFWYNNCTGTITISYLCHASPRSDTFIRRNNKPTERVCLLSTYTRTRVRISTYVRSIIANKGIKCMENVKLPPPHVSSYRTKSYINFPLKLRHWCQTMSRRHRHHSHRKKFPPRWSNICSSKILTNQRALFSRRAGGCINKVIDLREGY